MQCVTPMIRYYQDPKLLSPLDKKKLERNEIKLTQSIIPRHEVYEKLDKDENLIRGLSRLNENLMKQGSIWRYQAIPCGHCWGCQLKYSSEWATRIMCECKKSEHNYFITFTYDEMNLPIPENTEYDGTKYENDGTWNGTLWPDDITKFINSLRKRFERKGHTGIKYFYAGEYCPTSENQGMPGRPHYHMILMNCPLDIKQFHDFYVDPKLKKLHWKSHEIEDLWDKGMIDIGEVEWSSAAYVARYCMKKIDYNTDKREYYKIGKIPEIIRMSRRPGIGSDYYDTHESEIYKTDSIIMKNYHGTATPYKPPKAWDRKFKKAHPEEWERVVASREESAKRAQDLEQELADYSDLKRLEMKANNILVKGKMLPRDLVY